MLKEKAQQLILNQRCPILVVEHTEKPLFMPDRVSHLKLVEMALGVWRCGGCSFHHAEVSSLAESLE